MGFFTALFPTRNPVESMAIDDLKLMEIKITRKIDDLQTEINQIDSETQILFEKAKSTKSRSEELNLARRIKTTSQKKEMKLAAQSQLEKELRAVSNILILKEYEKDLKSIGVWESLKSLDPEELENWLVSKNLDSSNRDTLIESVVEMTSDAMTTGVEYEDDLDDILETIHAIKEDKIEPQIAVKNVTKPEFE
jgi:hypothetical protein